MPKHRYFDWASGENPFVWIVEETERLRYHHPKAIAERNPPPRPVISSLDRNNVRYVPALLQSQVPSPHEPGENVLKVPERRKL